MTPALYLAFVGLAVLLAITPGPDSLLVLRYSLRSRGAGFASAVGSSVGCVTWAVLVGLGLAALVEQSAEVYRALKVIGGLYLIYLGIQAFRHSRRRAAEAATSEDPSTSQPRAARGWIPAFGAGFLSTMTNPKVGLFYLAVVPQFLPAKSASFGMTLILGATIAIVGLIYLVILALIADRANKWLKRPRVTRNIERTSGGILAALGVFTATSVLYEK